eukprot:352193-Chlamydomonas_euryale.AAC.11
MGATDVCSFNLSSRDVQALSKRIVHVITVFHAPSMPDVLSTGWSESPCRGGGHTKHVLAVPTILCCWHLPYHNLTPARASMPAIDLVRQPRCNLLNEFHCKLDLLVGLRYADAMLALFCQHNDAINTRKSEKIFIT